MASRQLGIARDLAEARADRDTVRPAVTYSQGHVAMWLGVTTAAVSNWLARHWDTVPEPAAVIISPSGDEAYGWSAAQRQEWEAWYRDRHPATSRTRPRHYQ